MEKLKKCRICLVKNVRMYVVSNKNLQELYEKLTDVPFVTEDSRPTLACFLCCAKLKQCYQLQRKCLEAEELFAQMLNDYYETKPLKNQGPLGFSSEFNITPTVHISIVEEYQTESIAIKEELPDDIIGPKEEYQFDELEPENVDDGCLDAAYTTPHQSESDLEDDVPLMEFKIEVEEEQEVFKNKQRATETKRPTIAKKPKLDKPGRHFKGPYECNQRSFNPVKKTIQRIPTKIVEKSYKCDVCLRIFSQFSILKRHMNIHSGERPYMCDVCQRSFIEKCDLSKHIRIHTGEKPFKCDICQFSFRQKAHLKTHIRQHTGEKPFKCDVCQRSFRQKNTLTKHIRIHTGEKPYKCDVCQRRFSEKATLKNHIRIHTGEKPFKCDICQSSFKQKGYLKRHIRIHPV